MNTHNKIYINAVGLFLYSYRWLRMIAYGKTIPRIVDAIEVHSPEIIYYMLLTIFNNGILI